MNTFFKRTLCFTLCLLVFFSVNTTAEIVSQVNSDITAELVTAPSAILIEQASGQVLYELNPDEKLHIASVTKTMTMLLIMEAIDSGRIKLTDTVTTSDYASSMGGSQVFLEPGEQMSAEDMLKSIVISSGNDAAVAMAEHIAGTESAFVEMMNNRAKELGCINTHFVNCNGLDETEEHHSSARDIATISRELLKHPKITEYTTIWMDTIRDGAFGLSNTNKLIRFYNGANGIKTGYTSAAKHCLSAAAKRDGMQLIAVVLSAPSSAERFADAKKLLDYGFANYSVVNASEKIGILDPIPVTGGKSKTVSIKADPNISFIVKKGNEGKIETTLNLGKTINAPVKENQVVGTATLKISDNKVAVCDIVATEAVERMSVTAMFGKLIKRWLCMKAD